MCVGGGGASWYDIGRCVKTLGEPANSQRPLSGSAILAAELDAASG